MEVQSLCIKVRNSLQLSSIRKFNDNFIQDGQISALLKLDPATLWRIFWKRWALKFLKNGRKDSSWFIINIKFLSYLGRKDVRFQLPFSQTFPQPQEPRKMVEKHSKMAAKTNKEEKLFIIEVFYLKFTKCLNRHYNMNINLK